jgi:hypothetical protein
VPGGDTRVDHGNADTLAVEAHRVLNGPGANRHRNAVQMRHDRAILVDALDLGAPGELAKRGSRQIDDSAINELEPATKDTAEPAAVGRVGPRLEDDNDARGAGRLIGPCAQRFVELAVVLARAAPGAIGFRLGRRGESQNADQQGGYPHRRVIAVENIASSHYLPAFGSGHGSVSLIPARVSRAVGSTCRVLQVREISA